MATDRRAFLGHLALGLGVVACRGSIGQPAEAAAFVAIETALDSRLSTAAFFSASGVRLGRVPLDFRAHGMAEAGGTLIVFPRRPGDRFALIDRATLEVRGVVTAEPARRFYGHGAVSLDGGTLLTTENDLDTLQGVIGVYDLRPVLRRVGEIRLPGPGPHEIVRQPGGDRFLVALGGLETHPDYGRTPLNLPEFRSRIVEVDLRAGTARALDVWPGTEGVSLRHLAIDGGGRAWIGGQVADAARAEKSAIAWCLAREAEAMDLGDRLGGYVSSVAACGGRIMFSSKEAGTVVTLEADGRHRTDALPGASAVALAGGRRAMAGHRTLRFADREIDLAGQAEFDNHAVALS